MQNYMASIFTDKNEQQAWILIWLHLDFWIKFETYTTSYMVFFFFLFLSYSSGIKQKLQLHYHIIQE